MNKHFRTYLDSFKPKKELFYIFIVDVLFWGIIFGLFSLFGQIMQGKSWLLTKGKTPEQIQQLLLTMQPEEMQAFFLQMKSFMVFFIIGLMVLGAITLLLFSLSRGLIWNKLVERKLTSKSYWKWNGLNLALIMPLLVYLLVFAIVKILFNLFIVLAITNQTFLSLASDFINIIFLLGWLVFGFLVGYSFVKEYKVWKSLGEAFGLIKLKWKNIWRMFLLALGTAMVLGLALGLAGKGLIYQKELLVGLNAVVFLLFLAWMRVYAVKIMKE